MRPLVLLLLLSLQTVPARPQEVGVITGVIRSSDGTPTPGVRVFARPTASVSEDQTVLEAQTETDASGRYRLEIRPGQYNVGTGFLSSPTWYPGTIDIKTAQPVMVSSNATLSLDITALPTSVLAGNIQVQIVSAVTGSPMSGVTVGMNGILEAPPIQPGERIQDAAARRRAPRLTATTDASGNVVFRNLAPGRYSIQPRFSGYVIPNLSEVVVDRTRLSQRIQFGLTPNAAISGRLAGADGKPLVTTQVWAASLQYTDGRRKLVTRARTRTKEDGTYRLEPLEPGVYYVGAETGSLSLGFGSTYYPGTTNFDDAMPLASRNGQNLSGIDFNALQVKTFSVSGRVRNIDGTLVMAFNLAPHGPGATDTPEPIVLWNDSPTFDGDFTLRGIPAGSWDVFPVMPAPGGRTGTGHLEVIDRDVQGLAITLDPIREVRVRVTMADGIAVPPQITVSLVPRERPRDLTSIQRAGSGGGFVFTAVPPGKYGILLSNVPADYHVEGLRVGNRSVFETGVIEIGTGAIEPVEVVLASGGSSFRGFFNVTLAYMSADQLRDVRVTLIPSGTRRPNLALYQTISIPRAGEPFVFSGVVPGDYKVFAWSKLPEGAEKAPEFLKRYEEFGSEVHVTAERVGDVQVSVIAMP